MGKKDKGGTAAGENIRVCVRVRPLSTKEREAGCREAVELDIANASILVHHAVGDPTGPFTFDAVYNNSFKQRDIFIQEVYPMVESVLQGYNATVFAYGQSGSGKTYTMTGAPGTENAGVLPNTIAHIFDAISKLASPSKQFQVKVSHLELYNGKARDLLSDSAATLEVKQNLAKNFYVKGLIEEPVGTLDQTLHLFDTSIERRRTGCHDLNEHSSRSHSIFTISVESLDFEADPTTPQHMVSKLNLVDLAGSERQSKTGAAGDTLKEGCNINLSLSALGTVIDTLSKGKGHVPYRGSPLTMLLKDSLGGNSKTVMFANVGPADRNVSETISTLRFADRAKQITNKPMKNLDPKDLRIQELQAEVERLQKRLGGSGTADLEEIEVLKEKIEQLEVELTNAYAAMEKDKLSLEEDANVLRRELNTLQKQLHIREAELLALREERQLWSEKQASGEENALEVRRLVLNFVKGAMTATDLRGIAAQKGLSEAVLSDPSKLDAPALLPLLEGIREHFTAVKKSAITEESLERFLKEQATAFEKKFASYKGQQELEKAQLSEAKSALQEKVEAAGKEVAEAKVRVQQLQQELIKANLKAEKQLRKAGEKLEKALQEQKAQSERADKTSGEACATLALEVKELQQQLREAKRLAKEAADGADHRCGSLKEEFDQERQKWQSTLDSQELALEQSKARIEELEALLAKLQGGSERQMNSGKSLKASRIERDGESPQRRILNETVASEDMEVDPQALYHLQRGLRVQYQLMHIRRQQERQLEALLKQHHTQTQAASDRQGARISAAVQELASALEAKERELADTKEKHTKDQEKLVKKVNKKLQEFAQKEAHLEEERTALEEEKNDLLAANEELNRTNEQLEMEIESLKIRMDDAEMASQRAQKAHKVEITALRLELEEAHQELAEAQQVLAGEYEKVKEERDQLLETVGRLNATLAEQMTALEKGKETWRWTQTVLEREKKKNEDQCRDIGRLEAKLVEMETHWRQHMADNENKLLAINNRKMQEQVILHQLQLEEEQKQQKTLKDKLKKAKNSIQKEKQKYDELVLEYDQLQRQYEEFKVNSMRMYRDKTELEIEDSSSNIKALIQSQAQERQARNLQFELGAYSGKRSPM